MKKFFKRVEKIELKYKGLSGEAKYIEEDEVFCGKIINTRDLVTFEAETVSDLESEFKKAVDDYLQFRHMLRTTADYQI